MGKNINESLQTVERLLKEISRVNDAAIKQTENLKMALLNLQIEDARIEENTGIVPIAEQIERVIKTIHDNTDNLVKQGRKELRQAFEDIKEYIEEKEGKENE
ncbi:hypothetical protein [Clostridium beijerinckii]|uniref:hypothetical protein n=1 Tax=Clostridium beijerinckii TaxID=1520 RepID=UPI000478949C|nr:hypothetical protein [Clostridium beijerinckii]